MVKLTESNFGTPPPKSIPFWDTKSRYGIVHKSPDPTSGKGSLLIFVHGLFGDSRHTWGNMPAWVMETAGAEMDVISFAYPTTILQRCGVALAADDLRTWLETEFAGYRYLLFVTHSTGGLVVKQMLRQAFPLVQTRIKDGRFDYGTSNSVWMRTRRVIHIAVPHTGGDPFVTALTKFTYLGLYCLIAPLLKFLRFVSQGKWDLGKNQILLDLRWKNPWLLALEEEFVDQQRSAAADDLPYPVVHDLYAKSDLSVPVAADSGQRELYFRGTHKTVKVPNRPGDPIIVIVAEQIRPYLATLPLTIVDRVLARIAEVDKATSTESLIDGSKDVLDDDHPITIATGGPSGSQAEVCDRVIEAVRAGAERPYQMVVTGVAGVGKSTVMRKITWRLGRNYLSAPMEGNPLPFFIPMQQITLTHSSNDNYSWETLWRWWINWAQSMYPDSRLDLKWLEQQFHSEATVIILDGLDDFLVNHPMIGLSTLVSILREAANRYANNTRFSFVIGIRSGFHGLERLATGPKDIFEVLRLSTGQARQRFPACKQWLASIKDPGLLDFVLTPLILSNYEPDPNYTSDPQLLTQTTVMDQTLRTVLRRSNLIGVQTTGGGIAEIDHLLLALTLISWLLFYRHRGEIDMQRLRIEAGECGRQWKTFLENHPLANEARDILMGIGLVEHPDTCAAILKRTVFVASGPDMYRFSHRNWQEFLLAQYFVLCLKWGYIQDFGVIAFNSHIYRMAGDTFGDAPLSETRMENVIAAWKETRNTYITGNVIAFLAWTRTAIDTRALQCLLDELPGFEALSRVVLIAGLGYRVLVNADDDRSVADLRRTLFPKLQKFADPRLTPVDDPVASSLAWCYQKAFAEKFSMPAPESPWPGIGFDDQETRKALPMICTVSGGELILDERSRSLQLAFLVPILDAYDDCKLTIRALHYLYYLVVARKHGVHVFELSQELPQILAKGGQFEQIVKSFHLVPEVLELYRVCQMFHQKLDLNP